MLIKVSEKRILKRLALCLVAGIVVTAELRASSLSNFALGLYAKVFAAKKLVLQGRTEHDLSSSINQVSRFASAADVVAIVARDPRIEKVRAEKDWFEREIALTIEDSRPYFALANTLGYMLLSRTGQLISFEAEAPESLVKVGVDFSADLPQGNELFVRIAKRIDKIERTLSWSVAEVEVKEAEMVLDFVEHPVRVFFGVDSLIGDQSHLETELKRLRVLLKTLTPDKMAILRSVNLAFRKVAVAKFR